MTFLCETWLIFCRYHLQRFYHFLQVSYLRYSISLYDIQSDCCFYWSCSHVFGCSPRSIERGGAAQGWSLNNQIGKMYENTKENKLISIFNIFCKKSRLNLITTEDFCQDIFTPRWWALISSQEFLFTVPRKNIKKPTWLSRTCRSV